MGTQALPLRPMQLPEAVGWWPMAPGWWLLIVLSMVIVFALIWWLRRRLADPRRFALAELQSIQQRYQESNDKRALINHCNQLLKRTTLTLFPRQDVAALSGDDWLAFLLQNSRGCQLQAMQCLADGPYRPHSDYDTTALLSGCRQWLKTAKKGKPQHV